MTKKLRPSQYVKVTKEDRHKSAQKLGSLGGRAKRTKVTKKRPGKK